MSSLVFNDCFITIRMSNFTMDSMDQDCSHCKKLHIQFLECTVVHHVSSNKNYSSPFPRLVKETVVVTQDAKTPRLLSQVQPFFFPRRRHGVGRRTGGHTIPHI